MSTKYYQCPECGGVTLCAENDIDAQTCYRRENCDGKRMIPVQVTPETQEPWDEIARTLGYEDRHDMQGAFAASASYLRNPPKPSMTGVENQHPKQLADELDKAVKAMETPKIPFHTVNPEEPYDGDLVWTADGRAWAFYAAKHGWNRAPERDRKPTPETPEPKHGDLEYGSDGQAYTWQGSGWFRFPALDKTPQPSDDEKIERMARAMVDAAYNEGYRWDDGYTESYREIWRNHAKAALAALETPATPKLPEGVRYVGERPGWEQVLAINTGDGRYNPLVKRANKYVSGYIVTEEYILNKIQEDIENA